MYSNGSWTCNCEVVQMSTLLQRQAGGSYELQRKKCVLRVERKERTGAPERILCWWLASSQPWRPYLGPDHITSSARCSYRLRVTVCVWPNWRGATGYGQTRNACVARPTRRDNVSVLGSGAAEGTPPDWKNFLLQGQPSVLTLSSVSVPPPYYRTE